MIEWYWLFCPFIVGFFLCYVMIKRRVDLSSTIEMLTNSGYASNMERHKDFHSLFTSTEKGKRIMKEIMTWGHQWEALRSNDSHVLAFKNGERTLAMKILTTVHAEPKDLPKTTKEKTHG